MGALAWCLETLPSAQPNSVCDYQSREKGGTEEGTVAELGFPHATDEPTTTQNVTRECLPAGAGGWLAWSSS